MLNEEMKSKKSFVVTQGPFPSTDCKTLNIVVSAKAKLASCGWKNKENLSKQLVRKIYHGRNYNQERLC